jgi:hypothetical protein
MPLNTGAHAAAVDDAFANAPPVIAITDNEANTQGSSPPRASTTVCTHARPLVSPAATKQAADPSSSSPAMPVTASTPVTLHKAMEPSGVLGESFVYNTPVAPGDSAGTYTLPTGHFWIRPKQTVCSDSFQISPRSLQ